MPLGRLGPVVASGIETNSDGVEGAQPYPSAPGPVLGGEGRAGGSHRGIPQWLGRKRPWLAADHREVGAFGVADVGEIEGDACAKSSGGHAEPNTGVNREVVSMTPAHRCVNERPASCGKISKKCCARRTCESDCSSRGSIRPGKW